MTTLPYSPEAEVAVLASCMCDPDALALAQESVTPEDFYLMSHRLIFQVQLALFNKKIAVDFVTVTNQLQFYNQLEQAGGPSAISNLAGKIGSSAAIGHWAGIVKAKSNLRRMIVVCQQGMAQAQEDDQDAQEIINTVVSALGKIETGGERGLQHVNEIYKAIARTLEEYQNSTNVVSGLISGYEDLDAKTLGFNKKRLTICAARPGVGKTAFACNLAYNMGIKSDAVIAFFSLEMDAESIGNRIIGCAADVKINNIMGRWVRGDEWVRLVGAGNQFARSGVWIDDTGRMPPQMIRARAMRLKREVGRLDMVIVDYIGLMSGTHRQKRNEEIGEYSHALKELAKDLDLHVFCLAQLNRAAEERAKPQLSNLKESGDLEQDADMVIFIHPETEEKYGFIVAKNRHGYRGHIFLRWIPHRTRFENWEPPRDQREWGG